jgi:hypothetical protein
MMRRMNGTRLALLFLALPTAFSIIQNPAIAGGSAVEPPKLLSLSSSGEARTAWQGTEASLKAGQSLGPWVLMGVLQPKGQRRLAVFEDFSKTNGHMLFVGEHGVQLDLPKSAAATWVEPKTLYRGHTLEEVFNSERDLLGGEILAQSGDPAYEEVASCFAPISKMYTYSFVGTPECMEKIGVFYGGITANFDPAAYVPEIRKIRDAGRVLDGLVGGWLPALRFVYPEKPGDWSELVLYAPMRVENGNPRVQPVWYRVCRVEGNTLKWVRYFDSYHPFPPRMEAKPESFYDDLLAMRAGWERALASGMHIDIPDERLANLARHSLVREMMTRINGYPKYGVFDRSYGGSEHDGFPDSFTVDTSAMLAWGLFDPARQYLDNYFSKFVRDDGSILYRGPETGQYGRMLTVAAQYANDTGDQQLLLRLRPRLDAVTKLLLSLRGEARKLPPDSPAYGIIAGWCEADACLDPDPLRYMQPYFSNGTEAARGFEELGAVWERIGAKRRLPELVDWGRRLRQEARALNIDVQAAIARSLLTNTQPPCLPAIAGVTEPFHIAVARDKLDPQFRSYRAFMEMLFSGNLTREQVQMIVSYRAAHHDIILGIPTVYGHNTHELGGFLSYGQGFGLLQYDHVREYLLLLYSLEAHQYARGTWVAPETRPLTPKQPAAAYCCPAQMTVPLLTKWMVVFEEPDSEVLWLAKATPRSWLEDGKTIAVTNAPTRWGRLSFQLRSHLKESRIETTLILPPMPESARIKLRVRAPEGHRLRAVTMDGKPWNRFDADQEIVVLPGTGKREVELTMQY